MSMRARAAEGLLRGLAVARGRLSRAALVPTSREGPRWRLATALDPPSDRVFLSRAWFDLKAPTEGRLDLVWEDPAGPTARLTVRDNWIPGVLRQWELMAEPDGPPGVDQLRLLRGLLALARKNRVDEVFCFSNMARWTDPGLPELFTAGEAEPFGTYVTPLAGGSDGRRARLHKKHRYQLKQAEKAGVEVRDQVDPATFIQMMTATYERGGKARPFSPAYLRRVITGAGGLPVKVVSTWHGGACQAALIAPYDRRRGYFLHGATCDRPASGSAVLAHVTLMGWLADAGVAAYDLGGARAETDDPRLEGIFRFKRRFGGPFEACVRFRHRLTNAPRAGQRLWDVYRARSR